MSEPAPLSGDKLPAGASGARADQVLFQVTEASLARILEWTRRSLGWLTAAYVASLPLLLLGLERWGERFWGFSLLLYSPAQVLLLPLLVLTPLCLLFRWRLVLWHIAAALLLFFVYMTFRWHSVPPVGPAELKVITFNAGESNRAQILSFVETEKPDLILLQDTHGGAADLRKRYPGLYAYGSDLGQFAIASKFPIEKAEPVRQVLAQGQPVAVRYEIHYQGRTLAVYNVHLPTPRQQLARFLGGRRLIGDLAGHGKRAAAYGDYRQWVRDRIELAQGLDQVFAGEKEALIAGGDFNTPDHGYIYHLFAGQMSDAFAHTGRGWGLSFPGTTHNPISFFGPWLRIDYLWAGRGWRAIECRPEPGNKSQHKAVFARFAPLPLG